MSVLHRGKSTILQTFPAEDVVRWNERLSTAPPEGRHSQECKCLWYLVSDLLFKKEIFFERFTAFFPRCLLVSRSGNLTLVVLFYLLLWFLFSSYSCGVTFWSPWSSYSSRSAGDTQEGEQHLSMANQLYQCCEHKILIYDLVFIWPCDRSSVWFLAIVLHVFILSAHCIIGEFFVCDYECMPCANSALVNLRWDKTMYSKRIWSTNN